MLPIPPRAIPEKGRLRLDGREKAFSKKREKQEREGANHSQNFRKQELTY